MNTSDGLLTELRREFPKFRIVEKKGDTFSVAIDLCLRVLTLGGQCNYLTRYHTVLGETLYVPATWSTMTDVDRVILLRHERVHLRQRRQYGSVAMGILYLFVFFPIGLAWGRARLEWQAYGETLRATAELKGMAAARDSQLRENIVRRFTGPDYAWMWPFRSQVENWYEQALTEIERCGTCSSELPVKPDETGSRADGSK